MNVQFDPFEVLKRTAHSENANLDLEPAKAANPAKVFGNSEESGGTLATLAALAGGKSESEAADCS